MKLTRAHLTIFLLFFAGTLSVQGQSVQLQNLFDTGLNMGYLLTHWQNGTAAENYGIWARNAEQEWQASWSDGTLPGIRVDQNQPTASEQKFRNLLVSLPTAGCTNRWYKTKEPIYDAGVQLGAALVESVGACSECLSLSLQKAALDLRQIGTTRGITRWVELGSQLDNTSKSLRKNLSESEARLQNARQTNMVEATINEVKLQLLPQHEQSCTENASQSDGTEVTRREKERAPVKKRQMVIKAGINSTFLTNTANGSSTTIEPGFEAGIQMIRGRKVFLGLGVSYFRYGTGEELTARFQPGQVVTYDNFFIGGFKVPVFLGVAPINRKALKLRLYGGGNLYTSTAMVHTYSSIGDLVFDNPSFTYMAGAQLALGFLLFDLSYENGITEMLVGNADGYKLTALTLSAGINF